jgi:hypothetical protein
LYRGYVVYRGEKEISRPFVLMTIKKLPQPQVMVIVFSPKVSRNLLQMFFDSTYYCTYFFFSFFRKSPRTKEHKRNPTKKESWVGEGGLGGFEVHQ